MSATIDATPATLPPDPDAIPAELKALGRWVVSGDDKIPYTPLTGRRADPSAPTTGDPFPDALALIDGRRFTRLGLILDPAAGLVGFDWDACRDPSTGEIDPAILAEVTELGCYAEVSPSGAGLRGFAFGTLPAGRRKKGNREVYDRSRYLSVTGCALVGHERVEERTAAIARWHAEHFGPNGDGPRDGTGRPNGAGSPPLGDDDVLDRARGARNGDRFCRLWAGDASGHGGDDSAADLALLSLLAFWTQDPAQLDRLFRRSGLMREKWERPDYRERTVMRATERSEVWAPGQAVSANGRGANAGADRGRTEVPPECSDTPGPTLDAAALVGLPGEVVQTVGPQTEGDPVAVLVNFLVMFGNAIGSGPHVAVGGARHGVADFAAQVGDTAKARKGTAFSDTLRVVKEADPTWAGTRVTGGLSSGEGLVYPIRDPVETIKKGETVVTDPGEPDKRLLVVEEEFSAVLKVATREGNTLTEQLREAWDGRQLGAMTRNSPLRASSPHVSILAHITKDELLRVFDSTDAANGFGNRFAWFAVKRSKFLPEGGQVPADELADLVSRTRDALAFARKRGAVRRDDDARALWAEVYPVLSAAKPGLLGALTARGEAHVLRWSLLYALLDCASEIGTAHLLAALALWDYAEASARHIFGDATGDPIADRILAALRADGPMAQSEIVDLFGRNVNGARLGRAQEGLVRAGLVRSEQEATGGRPRTVWRAT